MPEEVVRESKNERCHVKCTGKRTETGTVVRCETLKGTPKECGHLTPNLYEEVTKELEEDEEEVDE
jgi:hypothetical protein